MKLPNWMLTKIKIAFENKWPLRVSDGYIIFFGAEWSICSYGTSFKDTNTWVIRITIFNFDMAIKFIGHPEVKNNSFGVR